MGLEQVSNEEGKNFKAPEAGQSESSENEELAQELAKSESLHREKAQELRETVAGLSAIVEKVKSDRGARAEALESRMIMQDLSKLIDRYEGLASNTDEDITTDAEIIRREYGDRKDSEQS